MDMLFRKMIYFCFIKTLDRAAKISHAFLPRLQELCVTVHNPSNENPNTFKTQGE